MRHKQLQNDDSFNASYKANKVLQIILVAIFLIILRIWHLAVIQRDERQEAARKPQEKTIFIPAQRGTIRDRFNIPLAINKIHYTAAVSYAPIRQIPSISWIKNSAGKMERVFKRREYIKDLAQKLADILDLDSERLEDLIHSKASLYHQIPYTIKDSISEKEYYQLKMFEKDWPGIQAQRLSSRTYPFGRSACDILGYLGPIDRKKYDSIVYEMHNLEQYLHEYELNREAELPEGFTSVAEVEERLSRLRQRAYTINDAVGKAGIESRFEEDLRGFFGIKRYYSDAKGNFLHLLPGNISPQPGQRLILSLSIELQQFAEELLIQNEQIRPPKVTALSPEKEILNGIREPWIKGGAIIAIDPNSGEILALASHPRYDPNDFILLGGEKGKSRRKARQRWLESDEHIAAIWDQKIFMERERYDDVAKTPYDEAVIMNWNTFLSTILPEDSVVRDTLDKKVKNIGEALKLQKSVEYLLLYSQQSNIYWLFNYLFDEEKGHETFGPKISLSVQNNMRKSLAEMADGVKKHKKILENYFTNLPNNYDKVLLIDLCRLAVDSSKSKEPLDKAIGIISLSAHKESAASLSAVEEAAFAMAKELFRSIHFKKWRLENEKKFLQAIRKREKENKQYARPYIDYLDSEQERQFTSFWEKYRSLFLKIFLLGKKPEESRLNSMLIDSQEVDEFIKFFLAWHSELLQGAHSGVEWLSSYFSLQQRLSVLGEQIALEYLDMLRPFHKLTRPLFGSYKNIRKKQGVSYEKDLAASFYPLYGFGYGRSQAYRQAATQGSIFKLVTAYEAIMQKWQSFGDKELKNKQTLNPLEMTDKVFREGNKVFVGYDSEGHPIPQLYKGGRMPRSLTRSIGKLDVIRALETSSNPFFALLAAEVLSKPDDLAEAAKKFSFGIPTGIDLPSEIKGKVPEDLATNRSGLYATAIGQHTLVTTPLQTAVMLSAIANGGKIFKPKLINFRVGYKNREIDSTKASQRPITAEPSVVRWQVPMPEIVRAMLVEGLERTVAKTTKQSITQLRAFYKNYPEAIKDYLSLNKEMIGKTSTAEAIEQISLDRKKGVNLYNHIWFGGICFAPKNSYKPETYIFNGEAGQAELVVVVYLRYGAYGKETAPLAAQVAAKWRAIKKQSEQSP